MVHGVEDEPLRLRFLLGGFSAWHPRRAVSVAVLTFRGMGVAFRNRRRLGGLVLAAALLPGSARAQPVTQAFEEIQRHVKVGQTLVVIDENGREVKGKVETLSISAITVGARTFTEAATREVRLPDPLWNGMLIGAATGAGLAAWDYAIDPSEPSNAAIFAVSIGLGTAIGAGIDALRRKGGKLLYASSRQTARMSVLPILERTRQGAQVSIRF